MKTALTLIAFERTRQIAQEGWTAEHDDGHTTGDLVKAAACYAMPYPYRIEPFFSNLWPWDKEWWKPTPNNRIRELVKAGALIVAEIERLQRLQKQTEPKTKGNQ